MDDFFLCSLIEALSQGLVHIGRDLVQWLRLWDRALEFHLVFDVALRAAM